MMQKKIKLDKDKGPIVFLGSTNAMPMMYAIELKNLGYEVIYFVDRPQTDLLNRPENHFPGISYPYPKWIIEVNIKSQMLLPFFRKLFYKYLSYKLRKVTHKTPQAYVLNSLFTSLACEVDNAKTSVISLSHGGDLDSWGDIQNADILASSFCKYSFFRYLPKALSKFLIKLAVNRQFNGYLNSHAFLYFPKGFNENGDRVVDDLVKAGITYIPRFDVSFHPLAKQDRRFKVKGNKLILFSGVRFTYKNFSEGNEGYNKGNDEIIKGIAQYYKLNKNIEVHFVEKGLDYLEAKKLCRIFGIEEIVKWHKEMTLANLLDLYSQSDICFDQVGKHWIGAIGAYALYLGKPLIANDLPHVSSGIWPSDNPIFTASTANDVYECLLVLQNENERLSYHTQSKIFASKYLGPNKVLNELFEF
ncbi:hypothetical protein [Shewanella algae]|uniref:hypothetical protein n=1 Tax=Shewanella algae TaxID=38313 RepID=UPI0031F503B3